MGLGEGRAETRWRTQSVRQSLESELSGEGSRIDLKPIPVASRDLGHRSGHVDVNPPHDAMEPLPVLRSRRAPREDPQLGDGPTPVVATRPRDPANRHVKGRFPQTLEETHGPSRHREMEGRS